MYLFITQESINNYLYFSISIKNMPISINLSDEMKKQLDDIAKNTERNRTQIIKLAIKKYLEENATNPTKKSKNFAR
jgi:metal-responsive CopG/Arc/MetJ family transcriptional regulator